MDKRALVRACAFNTLKDHRITTPSLDSLVYIITSSGYDIIDFCRSSNPGGVAALIAELSLHTYVETCNAFSYRNKDIKLIFVLETLSETEKRYALAHELGHIMCGHMDRNGCSPDSIEDECEANEFAHYLLNQPKLQRARIWTHTHKKFLIPIAISIIIAVSLFAILLGAKQNGIYRDGFYVTDSGERYHERDCITISGNKGVHRMTEEDFSSGQYSPCQVCLPN